LEMENAIRRGQVYGFLAEAFVCPRENWSEDVDLVARIVRELGWIGVPLQLETVPLLELQAAFRGAFGAAGSLGYETEYGLPHEYRQSQEMADIAGFYRAFGFEVGGPVRERADHVAVELEFMHILALKEAYALDSGVAEHVAICREAQGKFLQDHLGRWIGLFAQSVAHNTAEDSSYAQMARFAAAFVQADAERLGVRPEQPALEDIQHTPFAADFSCEGCALAGMGEQGFVRADTIYSP
jgi:TorA maturation chaperone TorD